MQTFYRAILPCSLAAFTTILGIGSLAVSKMVPIQTFGIFASLTLFLGTIWFFLYILSALQERPIRQWFPDYRRSEIDPADKMPFIPEKAGIQTSDSEPIFLDSGSHRNDEQKTDRRVQFSRQDSNTEVPQTTTFWDHFGLAVFYGRYPITALTFLLLIVFAFGIKELHTSVSFHGLMPKDSKMLLDYRTLEEQVGGLIPIEVVVHFPDKQNEERNILEQVYFLASLVAELKQLEDVDTAISVLNFLPSLPPQTGGGRAVAQRAALEGRLNRNQERLRELRFFNTVESNDADAGNYWRISLRISTQKRLNYATMLSEVEDRLNKAKETNDGVAENVRVDVTGTVPLVFRAQQILLWDLIYSFMTAFALIALTLMVVLRGIVRGLLAMIPNVFPCVIVFGMLGLCGIPVDMGSMMTASVALGISVDNTLHLLTWVNSALRRGLARKEAVLYALRRCSTALFQTMIICGFGMLVFGLSDFVPVARFAILLCVILMISFAGAVVALPAILFSPLGRFFEISDREKNKKWIL